MVGQSGTAMPASYVVTSPPTQISGNVAQTSSTAKRCGQRLTSVRSMVSCDVDSSDDSRLRRLASDAPASDVRLRSLGRRRLRLRIVVGVDFRRAVFVRTAVDDRLEVEVAVARRARCHPFQAVGVPRIAAARAAEEHAVDEVDAKITCVATMPIAQIVMNWFSGCRCWNVS